MLKNYLLAALRNLVRNKLYGGITIAGLAVGFMAAILIGLFVRDEFSYDTWIPDYRQVYRVSEIIHLSGHAAQTFDVNFPNIAANLKLDFPEIAAVARLEPSGLTLRHKDIEITELPGSTYWADPEIFAILPLKAIAGNLETALRRPDGMVMTRSMARKYFGRDDAVGETIEVNQKYTMQITAVIEDLPSNTHLNAKIFASGLASFSGLTVLDAMAFGNDRIPPENVFTYFRLRDGASISTLQQAMPGFIERHFPKEIAGVQFKDAYELELVPIAAIHLRPPSMVAMSPPGDIGTIYALTGIASLILIVAGINFVNLMTARATRRAVEVGVRKASGASRRDLMVQFIGEALVYVVISILLALASTELLLPAFNAFLQRTIALDYRHGVSNALYFIAMLLLVGLCAGFYPAFVLSAFRPVTVLKGLAVRTAGSGSVRQVLVVLQFAILIGLIVATGIVFRQTSYAMEGRLRLGSDQVLMVSAPCVGPLKDEIAALPGVRSTSCSSGSALNFGRTGTTIQQPDGTNMMVRIAPVDWDFLDLYGVRLLAGRMLSRDHATDILAADGSTVGPTIVINETAARKLGYQTPSQAIGQSLPWVHIDGHGKLSKPLTSTIIGVTADFSVASIRDEIEPVIYCIDPEQFSTLSVRIRSGTVPDTLKSIDKLWKSVGNSLPIQRYFLNRYQQELYADVSREGSVFAIFAGVALFIACLGLFGLSAFTAERRTKEIGIRKSMGATDLDIVRLLVWQFTKPVLWANLIAWPVGWYLMNRWLHGFAYHVDMEAWIFLAATGLALLIALATVSAHALLVARARPVTALRYE